MDGQHISLKEIVDTMMLWAEDPGNYLYGASRALVLTHAKRLLQELNYAGLRSVRIHEAEIAASGKVAVPADFVEYVRVYYCVGNYLMPAFENKHINTLQYESLKDVEEQLILTMTGKRILTPSGDYLTARVKLNESVPATGHPKNWCFLEGYKYDHKNNCFVLDYVPDGVSHVAIEYVADPLLSEPDPAKLCIHKYFEKAMEAGIFYRMIEMRRSVPANEKARAKREWTIKYRDAVKELNAKPQELIQAIMGWKHMRGEQGMYAGMGGQRIPEPKPKEILYMASFIEYVCQTLTQKPEKVRNRLTVSSVATKQKVTMTVTAEKEVHTDVEVSYSLSSRGRSASQSGKVTILTGRKTADVDVAADFYGQILQFSIYSVDGIVNADSDVKYIYEIESPVTLENLIPKPVNYIRATVVVDPSADRNKRIRITYTCAYPTASVVQVQCATNQAAPSVNYSSVDYLYQNKTTTSFFADDTFGGQTCLLAIVAVDGVRGAMEDSEYIYEVDATLEIVSPRRENNISITSEVRVWSVGLYAMSQYPVASPVQVRTQPEGASVYEDRLFGKGTNAVMSYPAPVGMYGLLCQSRVFRVNGVEGGLSDADFDYVMATPTVQIATPDSLPVVDWSLVRGTASLSGCPVKAVLAKAVGSDLTLVYTSANDGATNFGVIRAGELESSEVTFLRGTEYTVSIQQIAGTGAPNTDYAYGWDTQNRYPVKKKILINALSVNNIQPAVEWRLEGGRYKLYFKVAAEQATPSGVHIRFYWGPGLNNWSDAYIPVSASTAETCIDNYDPNAGADPDFGVVFDRWVEITGIGDPKQEGVTFDSTYEYRLRATTIDVPEKPLIDNHIRVTASLVNNVPTVKFTADYAPVSDLQVALVAADDSGFYGVFRKNRTEESFPVTEIPGKVCSVLLQAVNDVGGATSDDTYRYILEPSSVSVPSRPYTSYSVNVRPGNRLVPDHTYYGAYAEVSQEQTGANTVVRLTVDGTASVTVPATPTSLHRFPLSTYGKQATSVIESVNGVPGNGTADFDRRNDLGLSVTILSGRTFTVSTPNMPTINVSAILRNNIPTLEVTATYELASKVRVNIKNSAGTVVTYFDKEGRGATFIESPGLNYGETYNLEIASVGGVAGTDRDNWFIYSLGATSITIPANPLIDNHIRVTAYLVANVPTVKIVADHAPATAVGLVFIGTGTVPRTLTAKEDIFAPTNVLIGRNCNISLSSVNGVAGATTDSTYRYILDTTTVNVPDIPIPSDYVTVRAVRATPVNYDYYGIDEGDVVARPDNQTDLTIHIRPETGYGTIDDSITLEFNADFTIIATDDITGNCSMTRLSASILRIQFNFDRATGIVESKVALDFGVKRYLHLLVTTL